jgi:hypothetical protein
MNLHREIGHAKSAHAGSGHAKPVIPGQLAGAARREWEEKVLSDPRLRGSRLILIRVLLVAANGKCWCYPGNEYLAERCRASVNTIWRALKDLVEWGVIRIDHACGRRYIVFPSHPHDVAVRAAPQTEMSAPQNGVAGSQNGARILDVKPESETLNVAMPPSPNESTTDSPTPEEPGLVNSTNSTNWRVIAAENGMPLPPAPAPATSETVQDAPGRAPIPRVDPKPHPVPRSQDGASTAATIEVLKKLGPGATAAEVTRVMLSLTLLFDDHHSRAYYRSVANQVATGLMPARWLTAAVREAMRPGVRNPGAVFAAHIKRCELVASSRSERAGPVNSS